MDLRQYDPAIARWTVIDPITHHDFSPYQAFDNNPVFFADPSGADSEVSQGGNAFYFDGADVADAFNIVKDGWTEENSGDGPGDKKKKEEGRNREQDLQDAGMMAIGFVIGGNSIVPIMEAKLPKLTAENFYLKSFNPKTGYVTLSAYPGQVFEKGTVEALESLKYIRVSLKFLGTVANVASFSTALYELYNENYVSATIEATSSYIGIQLAKSRGALAGIAWTAGWEGGRWLVNNWEWYNRKAHGIYSNKYLARALANKWDIELSEQQLDLAKRYVFKKL